MKPASTIRICKHAIRLGPDLTERDSLEATLPLFEKAFEADETGLRLREGFSALTCYPIVDQT